MGSVGRFGAALRRDLHATARYFRSLREILRLRRLRKADGKALVLAYGKVGTLAANTPEAEEQHSFGGVKGCRALVAELSARLRTLQEDEERDRQNLGDRTRLREAELDGLCEELSRRKAILRAARSDREIMEGRVRDLEAKQRKSEPGDDRVRIEAEIAEVRLNLPTAGAAEAEARAAQETQDVECDREKRAWSEEQRTLSAARRESGAATRRVESELADAGASLTGSLEELGKSVCLAGTTALSLAGPIGEAKEITRRLDEHETGLQANRDVMAEVRRETSRVLVIAGGALVVLIVGIALLAGGSSRAVGTDRVAGADPAGSPSPANPTPTPGEDESAADPPAPTAPAAAGERMTEKVRRAVLALAALAPRMEDGVEVFRSTRMIDVRSEAPAPGGGTEFELAAGAEERDGPDDPYRPVTVLVRVRVDDSGRVASARITAVLTEEDRRLEKLLEGYR
ncbi:MAG: hypothetical protein V2A76_04815 [Planctomycetota bacterium]